MFLRVGHSQCAVDDASFARPFDVDDAAVHCNAADALAGW
jgi:hypothetical protein